MITNKKSIRETHQRQIVYDTVMERCDHPTADTIYEVVRKKDSKISKGTVYRNLKMLSEMGKISHIKIPGGDRYDKTILPHHHFMCTSCGKVSDIVFEYNYKDDRHLEKKTGFIITGHHILYEGLCLKCKNKKEENKNG